MTRPTRSRKPGFIGGLEEILRFVVSGSLGTSVFVFLYWLFGQVGFSETRVDDAVRWAVPYLITSLLTHWLHRHITFRWASPYWRSLRRTYVIYGCSLMLTTAVHDQLIWSLDLGNAAAFLVSVTVSGAWNYVLFRHWGFAQDKDTAHASNNRP